MYASNALNQKIEAQIREKLTNSQFKSDEGKILKIEYLLITIQQDLSTIEIEEQTSISFYGEAQFTIEGENGNPRNRCSFSANAIIDDSYKLMQLLGTPIKISKK